MCGMGMGFAPTWLRQVSPPASHDHFNHCTRPHHSRESCKKLGNITVPHHMLSTQHCQIQRVNCKIASLTLYIPLTV